VTLTFHFEFWLDHLVHGGYGWGSPTTRRQSNCQTKKLKSGYGLHWGCGTKTNWPTDRRSQCNLKLNIVLHIPDPSSRQRGRPAWIIKNVIVTHINVTSGHLLQKRQDTKTNWPTDCRS
jgi:hypothetical protein